MILLYIDIASNDSSIAEMGREDNSFVHFMNWPLGSILRQNYVLFTFLILMRVLQRQPLEMEKHIQLAIEKVPSSGVILNLKFYLPTS